MLRAPIADEQPLTQTPKPAKPQFSEERIAGALSQPPALRNIGTHLIPSQEAVIFLTELRRKEAAIDPPYTPSPALKSVNGPRAPHEAEFFGALEADVAP